MTHCGLVLQCDHMELLICVRGEKQPVYRISMTQESKVMLKICNNTGLLYVHRDELSHARQFVLYQYKFITTYSIHIFKNKL